MSLDEEIERVNKDILLHERENDQHKAEILTSKAIIKMLKSKAKQLEKLQARANELIGK